MTRTVSLLDYLPPYMREYREMQQIMAVEDPELQSLSDRTESIRNNQFIASCDLSGVKNFEKLSGIDPEPADSLNTRKSRLLAKWTDNIPYTVRVLRRKLDELCGKGSYSLTVDNSAYTVSVETDFESIVLNRVIDSLLSEILPANLLYGALYTGREDISIETEIVPYINNPVQCGCSDCGQSLVLTY